MKKIFCLGFTQAINWSKIHLTEECNLLQGNLDRLTRVLDSHTYSLDR